MTDKKEKKSLSPIFVKGNFSCDLRNEIQNKTDFVKAHEGKLNVDINKLYVEIGKSKKAYDKESGKPSK